MLRRQELEAVANRVLADAEKVEDGSSSTGKRPLPFLSAQEASQLLGDRRRAVGVLTYGWTTRGDPDPTGTYLADLRAFLQSEGGAHLVGLFWEYVPRIEVGTAVISLTNANVRCSIDP